jgi:hypothetical protein
LELPLRGGLLFIATNNSVNMAKFEPNRAVLHR